MFSGKMFCLVFCSLIGLTNIVSGECEHGEHFQNLNDCRKFKFCNENEKIVDLSCEEDRYWNEKISSCDFRSNVVCPVATTTTTTTTPKTTTTTPTCGDCLKNKVPLYRLYNHGSSDHFYATSLSEADNAANNLGYVREGITGQVLSSTFECSNKGKYTPVHRLYRAGDHFYTASEWEADNAVKRYGYSREGVEFYCAAEQENCEGLIPLHKYKRGTDHFYTTSLHEGSQNVIPFGGKYEGILCYIWSQ